MNPMASGTSNTQHSTRNALPAIVAFPATWRRFFVTLSPPSCNRKLYPVTETFIPRAQARCALLARKVSLPLWEPTSFAPYL